MPPQDSGVWKYDSNNSSDANVGSSRSSQILASSYSSGQVRGVYGDRLQSQGSSRSVPVWLETGDAVANMYSEMWEEACGHARIRNAYFEQARHAYLVGNKVLAKELNIKGQTLQNSDEGSSWKSSRFHFLTERYRLTGEEYRKGS